MLQIYTCIATCVTVAGVQPGGGREGHHGGAPQEEDPDIREELQHQEWLKGWTYVEISSFSP